MTITVNAALLHAVSLCQSAEAKRYYLNGVYIHAHPTQGLLLVATDGHRLLAAHDENGVLDGAAMIVPVTKEMISAYKAFAKAYRFDNNAENLCFVLDGTSARVTFQDKEGEITDSGTVLPCKAIEGTFPDYSRVIPQFDGSKHDGIPFFGANADYILSFAKAGQIAANSRNPSPVTITCADPTSPMLVNLMDLRLFGVLMPFRSSLGFVPNWLRPAQA